MKAPIVWIIYVLFNTGNIYQLRKVAVSFIYSDGALTEEEFRFPQTNDYASVKGNLLPEYMRNDMYRILDVKKGEIDIVYNI